jgi:hypothetical protein
MVGKLIGMLIQAREKPRCCLLDTTYGVDSEEALWTALSSSDTFQSRQALPRSDPGKRFHPNELSHVFEKDFEVTK